MTHPASIDHQVLSDAADWFALLRSGEASERDTHRWRDWLHQHPDHLRGWQLVEQIEQQFQAATSDHPNQTAATLNRARQGRQQRRTVVKSLAVALATGGLGWASWRQTPLPEVVASWQAQYRTGTGEIRQLRLADGSQVWMNTDSAMDTVMSGPQRQIQLVRGEILIETGSEDPRPLVVFTPQGQMQPLGTRFTVRRENEQTFVAVYQGTVKVTNQAHQEALVPSRHQTRFSSSGVAPLSVAEPSRESWHKGILLADDTRLADLVSELGRYQHGYINVSPDVADLRVVGGFPLTSPEQALSMLETALPVRISRPLPWWTNILPR